jgi:hypothetical protein
MHQEREWFNRQLREYEAAHGFTPVVTQPSRIEEVRTRGRDLNAELGKDARAKSHSATSIVPKVIYSSPVMNLRAAAEVAKDLSNLSSEALRQQQARLNHLLSEATMPATSTSSLQILSVPTYTSWEPKDMIRPSLGNGRPPRQPALSLMKLSEPSLWTRPETTRTPEAAITDPVRI